MRTVRQLELVAVGEQDGLRRVDLDRQPPVRLQAAAQRNPVGAVDFDHAVAQVGRRDAGQQSRLALDRLDDAPGEDFGRFQRIVDDGGRRGTAACQIKGKGDRRSPFPDLERAAVDDLGFVAGRRVAGHLEDQRRRAVERQARRPQRDLGGPATFSRPLSSWTAVTPTRSPAVIAA